MSDEHETDRLKAALKAAEPAPDAARKAEAMARAMAEFDRIQGPAGAARPSSDRPSRAAFWTGVTAMFSKLTTRAALTGTASLAVIGLGLVLVVPYGKQDPGEIAVVDRTRTVDSTAEMAAITPKTQPPTAGRSEQAESGIDAAAPADLRAQGADEAATVGRFAPVPEPGPAPAQGTMTSLEEGFAAGLVAESEAMAGDLARRAIAPAPGVTDAVVMPDPDTEAYPEARPNPVKITAEDPVSTFSIDVDTASYAVVRSSLNSGRLPPAGAVRIEEMVNYFPYDWPAPEAGEGPFRPTVSVMQTPWNPDTDLVTVALQGALPARADRPPLNLVFLIDTSGSMDQPNKLPLLKQSFRLMLGELGPEDEVAIVTYAGSVGMALAPTPAGERDTILGTLERLDAGGSTAGQAGLQQAYALAREMSQDGEVGRILLATDGDFNVGLSDPEALKDFIAKEREGGTYLSVLGFGRGNLDDATMQALAQNGNGQAAYIDTLNEAQKVLVDQLSGALFPIADDVKIQIEWNPATVAEYRLIGYETRALRREDFDNDRVDAGEIGAGHAVTAIYEITPVGSPARLTDPLRYGAAADAQPDPAPVASGFADEFGFLRLRYKAPGEDVSRLIETPILTDTADGGPEARFAAAIAGFGQLLSEPKYLGDWGWDQAISLANSARGADPFGYRAEAVQLMRLAESLSR